MLDADAVLSGANAEFVANLYARYLASPSQVDDSWAVFFRGLNDDHRALLAELNGASWTPKRALLPDEVSAPAPKNKKDAAAKKPDSAQPVDSAVVLDSLRAYQLIRAYRTNGHFLANLDPLGLEKPKYHPDLDYANYGFTDADMQKNIFVNGELGFDYVTLANLIARLQQTYCGTMGVEFDHIQDQAQRAWLMERIEGGYKTPFTPAEKSIILDDLTRAEGLEQFLGKKYVGTKRFGLDGGEATIPALEEIIRVSAKGGTREVILGMAHRGRLNVLTNVFGKPFTALFSEFQGTPTHPDSVQGSGDVKYHMGTSNDRQIGDATVHLSLTANPSHLESVNPVVVGKVRAKQEQGKNTLGLLIHGDAAVAGQGLVAETLLLSDLTGYSTKGTVHIVINNQIGFTTNPRNSRSSPYCTDITKMVMPPIFHVNGDDPEAVVFAARLAAEFRQQFKKDVVLDIWCYRRFGHNESDEPAFTQPIMYGVIKELPSTRTLYAARLLAEGSMTQAEIDALRDGFYARLEADFTAAENYKPNQADWLQGAWAGLSAATNDDRKGNTATEPNQVKRVAAALTSVPSDFNLNSKITRQLKQKEDMFKTGHGFDWATAEALAFGTLVDDGIKVRLSGQDCGRGTFSQRHAALYDQTNEQRYEPLNHIREGQAHFEVIDSPLSEAAVLGFEYGYTLSEPRALVMWEGQFGDFVNGAQVLIDQYITSAESKWLRMSGLVMLLPHGYEGQGPEHSSARLERFLQQCAEDNIQVANCTTPANYFHILRRQVKRNFRKPLIIMTPKSLLRHKLCVSPLSAMIGTETFHRVLPDDSAAKLKNVQRVVLCTGKVYYDLFEAREAAGITNVALVRLEQLYPFPALTLARELQQYPNAEIIWCQEEPQNMGAWQFVDRRIESVLVEIGNSHTRPVYVGRSEAASPATGSYKKHDKEQAALVQNAITVPAQSASKPVKLSAKG